MRTRVIATFVAGIYLAAAGFFQSTAFGQSVEAIGKVLTAIGTVTVQHTNAVILQANVSSGDVGQLKVGDQVYQGDIIKTGADGAAGIVFTDGTTFDISKNANMELNDFVYDPKSKSNSTLINLKSGAFTFLAGSIAKTGNMRIETPVGTMGIRGTAPHVEILPDGTVKFTTLIEENKKKNAQKQPSSPQRQAQDDPAKQRADRELKMKLNICRGC